jgi:hypothetical protein
MNTHGFTKTSIHVWFWIKINIIIRPEHKFALRSNLG